MKRLLSALAIIVAAMVPFRAGASEPALNLGMSGYILGYGVYTDINDNDTAAAGDENRKFDFRKATEVLLSGEVALDNGITAGAEINLLMDREDATTTDASYLYLSGEWGRINFGENDGITGLLQVSAPAADEVVDGYDGDVGTFSAAEGGNIGYKHNDFGNTNKFVYITPVFNGFQAGFSYTPSASEGDLAGIAAVAISDTAGNNLENGMEIAARYEGTFEALDIAVGAGYAHADQEIDEAGEDDQQSWNAGLAIGWEAFDFGVAYVTTNNAAENDDTDTWAAGINYTTGPYVLGASYLNQQNENAANDLEVDRWSVGAIYEWGPGMTLRGSVNWQDAENVGGVATADADGTQYSVGTMLNF